MKTCFSVLLLFSFATATVAAAPLNAGISAGYTYDDNVTRAERDADVETDTILNVDAYASSLFSINDKSFFSIKGTLVLNEYTDFTGLSNMRLGVHGSYHIRPSTGYTSLRYFVQLSYEDRKYDSDKRDGSATTIQLGLSKRVTDLVSLRAGYIKEDVDADDYVFQTETNRLYLDAEYQLGKTNTMYATLGYQDGDIISTAANNAQLLAELPSRRYWTLDDAFSDLRPRRWAYRLTGNTLSLAVGDNYSFGTSHAIDGSVFYYDSESDGGSNYSGLIYNVNYIYSF